MSQLCHGGIMKFVIQIRYIQYDGSQQFWVPVGLAMKNIPYLCLDSIETDIQLMKLLSPEIARRYHALPIATAGGKITIAMACPEDTTASDAVASVIGVPVCFVQANPKEIEHRLDEIWPPLPMHRSRLLLWSPISDSEIVLLAYALSLTNLLEADLEQVDVSLKDSQSFSKLILAVERTHPELVIFQAHNLPLLEQVLSDFAFPKTTGKAPNSMLIVQNPMWPLATILLVLPDDETADNPAVNWTVQFACASQASVSVLPVLPPSSGLRGTTARHSVQTLLQTKNPLGKKMRHIAQRFSKDGIKGSFKLREGESLDQLRSEILVSNPDLVIIAAEHKSCLWQWISEKHFMSLLESINCPVLLAR